MQGEKYRAAEYGCKALDDDDIGTYHLTYVIGLAARTITLALLAVVDALQEQKIEVHGKQP